jgi:hypothetical protein
MNAESCRTILIYRALQKRLDDVYRHLDESPPLSGLDPEKNRSEDPEEALRLFMARYFPRVQRGKATAEDKTRFFALLSELAEIALTDDLRFLDAWNNAYEAILPFRRSDQEMSTFVSPFLQCYVFILKSHLEKLS